MPSEWKVTTITRHRCDISYYLLESDVKTDRKKYTAELDTELPQKVIKVIKYYAF